MSPCASTRYSPADMTFRIVTAASLDEGRRLIAADFSRLALTDYYATLPADLACGLIADSFLVAEDEVGDAAVAVDGDDRPVGLVAGYPLAELTRRQQAALYHLMSNLPREEVGGFMAGARALAAEVPAITEDGYYLARIGIAASAQGSGLADQLLVHFLADAGSRPAVLHVRGDNARAIGFYRRHGFAVERDDHRYWIMRRAAA